MIAADVVRAAIAAGLTLAAKGGQLSVVPADRLTPDLRALLVSHKVELLTYLRRAANDPPSAPPASYGTGRTTDGRPLAALVQCGMCTHFTPNAMNPEAGVGRCELGKPDLAGSLPYFPGCQRVCEEHVAAVERRDRSQSNFIKGQQ